MTEMIIKQLDIQDIKPYPNNPRKNAKAIDKVADSITQYGFQQPIVVDKDLVIVVGHTRYQAAKKLLLAQVPVLIAENLDSEQANGYRIMDNKSGEWADWDQQMLIDELSELITENNIQELSYETGFSESELNKLFAPDVDPIDEYNKTESYKSKLGDLWTLGNHKIYNGDSNDSNNTNALLLGEQIDCVWTDPPYGISYQSVNKINTNKDSHKIQNDGLSADQLDLFLIEHLSTIDHKVKIGAPIYWCHDITTC